MRNSGGPAVDPHHRAAVAQALSALRRALRRLGTALQQEARFATVFEPQRDPEGRCLEYRRLDHAASLEAAVSAYRTLRLRPGDPPNTPLRCHGAVGVADPRILALAEEVNRLKGVLKASFAPLATQHGLVPVKRNGRTARVPAVRHVLRSLGEASLNRLGAYRALPLIAALPPREFLYRPKRHHLRMQANVTFPVTGRGGASRPKQLMAELPILFPLDPRRATPLVTAPRPRTEANRRVRRKRAGARLLPSRRARRTPVRTVTGAGKKTGRISSGDEPMTQTEKLHHRFWIWFEEFVNFSSLLSICAFALGVPIVIHALVHALEALTGWPVTNLWAVAVGLFCSLALASVVWVDASIASASRHPRRSRKRPDARAGTCP